MHRLARAHNRFPSEVLQQITLEEFVYQIAFDQIVPLPDPELHSAVESSSTVNAIGGNKTKPKDFMRPRIVSYQMTNEQLLKNLKQFSFNMGVIKE